MDLKVCLCIEGKCHGMSHKDERGQDVPGRLVTKKEHYRHRMEDKARRLRMSNRTPVLHQANFDSQFGAPIVFADVEDTTLGEHIQLVSTTLAARQAELRRRQNAIPKIQSLVFTLPPKPNSTDDLSSPSLATSLEVEYRSPNAPGRLQLKYNEDCNALFLAFEAWLSRTINELLVLRTMTPEQKTIKEQLIEEFNCCWDGLDDLKRSEWIRQKTLPFGVNRGRLVDGRPLVQTRHYLDLHFSAFTASTAISYVMVGVLSILCGVSEKHCDFILTALQILLELSGSATVLPKDSRTVLSHLDLSPHTRKYLCCPKCCKLYHVPDAEEDVEKMVPEKCTFKATEGSSECGRSLRKTRRVNGVLKTSLCRTFIYHEFRQWFAQLLCRHGMEDLLDRDVFADGSADFQKDVWDGSILRNFNGPDGLPFITGRKDPSEGRYVFSFSWDGVNPFGNKEAGKKFSVGAMYLICLNLPIEERYKRENMFLVGIIPGPNGPSKEQLNHLVEPLIDDFVEFWEPGFFFEATPKFPNGRSATGAIVPVLCDLPAARQLCGFGSFSSKYICSYCWLRKDDINDVNVESWEKRCPKNHKELARQWAEAPTEFDQESLFSTHGVRYSVLLKLSYWNPIDFVAIDPMHAHHEGDLKRHCRGIWGFDIKFEDGDGYGKEIQEYTLPSDAEMAKGEKQLRQATQNNFSKLTVPVMYHLCKRHGCLPEERGWRKKKRLKNELLNLRLKMGWFVDNNLPAGVMPNPPSTYHDPEDIPADTPAPDVEMLEADSTTPDPPVIGMSNIEDKTVDQQKPSSTVGGTKKVKAKKQRRAKDTPLTPEDKQLATDTYNQNRSLKSLRFGELRFLYESHFTEVDPEVKTRNQMIDILVNHRQLTFDRSKRSAKTNPSEALTEKNDLRPKKRFRADVQWTQAVDALRNNVGLEDIDKEVFVGLYIHCLELQSTSEYAKVVADMDLQEILKGLRELDEETPLESESANAPGGELPRSRERSKKTKVIGRETLEQINLDVHLTDLPSWATRAPANLGVAKSGKLTASQWNATCTVHLVVTLVRLWGVKNSEDRHFKMLLNFMDLATAIKIANRRTITPSLRIEYTKHMKRYLTDLLELYPSMDLTPNQHLSLHFAENMERFGPGPASHLYQAERENRRLQQVPKNMKFGELEQTIFIKYCQAQKLQASLNSLSSSPRVDASIKRLVGAYQNAFCTDKPTKSSSKDDFGKIMRDSELGLTIAEVLAVLGPFLSKLGRIPAANQIKESSLSLYSSFVRYGKVFSIATNALRDSRVIVGRSVPDDWTAAEIQCILRYSPFDEIDETDSTFLVVRMFEELSNEDAKVDPYRLFPFVGGRIYYDTLLPRLCVIPLGSLLCHFACTSKVLTQRVRRSHIHVLPLDK